MRILLLYLRRGYRVVWLALMFAAMSQVATLLDPLILRRIIDQYASRAGEYTAAEFLRGVGGLLGLAVGLALFARFAKNLQDYFVGVISQRTGSAIYVDGISHSFDLPYAVLEDQRSGETLGTLMRVRHDVERFLSTAVSSIFITVIGLVFAMVYAFRVNWLIAPVFLVTVPLFGLTGLALGRRIKAAQNAILKQVGILSGSNTESLRNIELVKSLGLASQEKQRLHSISEKLLEMELIKSRMTRMNSFLQGTAVNVLRTSILFIILWLIFERRITVGQFVALSIYSIVIFAPLQELGSMVNLFRETQASLQAFGTILNTPAERQPPNPIAVDHLTSLRFEKVSFSYPAALAPALAEISFTAERGQTIAFVGPSGSGKTTLIKLLVGLYQPQRGRVLYNSTSNAEVDLGRFRTRIGLVTQDPQLFSGTIRENLLFANPDATDDECLLVMHQAAADQLLARTGRGLDTIIGEAGVKISGGERQRLSIARAMLRHPELLLFDEATSSLDSLTEKEISRTICAIAESRAAITILVAHRLSTIMHADRIYVLERGNIIESGNHSKLLARGGLYSAMWRTQLGMAEDLPITAEDVQVRLTS
jgi:ATP-binding cassette, subfamily B, bacterial